MANQLASCVLRVWQLIHTPKADHLSIGNCCCVSDSSCQVGMRLLGQNNTSRVSTNLTGPKKRHGVRCAISTQDDSFWQVANTDSLSTMLTIMAGLEGHAQGKYLQSASCRHPFFSIWTAWPPCTALLLVLQSLHFPTLNRQEVFDELAITVTCALP